MSAVIVRPRVQCVLRTATPPKPRQRMPRGTRAEGRDQNTCTPGVKSGPTKQGPDASGSAQQCVSNAANACYVK